MARIVKRGWCPYCGSKSGYFQVVKCRQYYNNKGEATSFEKEQLTEDKTMYCVSCKQIVRFSEKHPIDLTGA